MRKVILKASIAIVVLACLSTSAKADSIKTVTAEIKQGSVLTLKQGVASWWAGNLLTAQQQAAYGSPESLQLSINAVLKAIGLEQSIAGLSWCGLSNCVWVNAQSTVAIDPNAGMAVPRSLSFGVVSTPEPGVLLLLVLGLGCLKIIKKSS